MSSARRALVIGSGIGGLSLAIRLSSMGFDTTVLEKLDAPGGRAYVRRVDGFTFDMGPTVLTVPHFIEELFALERGHADLTGPDFPEAVRRAARITKGDSGGPATRKYVELMPIEPFYRIYFDDHTWFDYDGDPERTRAQIRTLAPEDLEGYERFHEAAKAIFERGFLELGYTHFGDPASMLRVLPDLLRLDAIRPLYSFVSRYFQSEKLRAVFSFEPLLVGGNPLAVPAIYAMIHFVEKTWGVHFARGGTGALVTAMVKKLEELGGSIRYDAEVARIDVESGVARGVTLASGESLEADVVASNADFVHTFGTLLPKTARRTRTKARLLAARPSMSVLVIYFGFRKDGYPDLDLRHHNIILGPRYAELLKDIFDRKILGPDFSQYLHVPTLTDPSLAPPGHHAAYTLVPVPHLGGDVDWSTQAEPFVQRVLSMIESEGYVPKLKERLVHTSWITPRYFETSLNSHMGNGFGLEPVLWQTAYFRPGNRSEDVAGLYGVGQSYQPGGGTPSVMMSAKMTAREIAKDFKVARHVLASRP